MSIAITQADGTVVNFGFSPQRNLQPVPGGAIARPNYPNQVVIAAGGTTPIIAGTVVVVVNTNGGNENLNLPDPRTSGPGGIALANGSMIYVVNSDQGGGGGNNVTMQQASGAGFNPGFNINGPGGGAPLQLGATFMVTNSAIQDGWSRVTI